jgi:hypothetical protein
VKYISIFIVLFISSCSPISSDSDVVLTEKLIGTWTHNYFEGSYGLIEYSAAGDKCEIVLNFDFSDTPELDFYWNKWTIENGVIKTTMHTTNTILEKGQKINDKITTLNNHDLTVEMIYPVGEYEPEYHHKSKHSLTGKVCEIVKKHLTRN